MQGGVNKFPGGRELLSYAPHNMESLINKFTNKYICRFNSSKDRGVWNKWQSLKNHCYKLNSNYSRTSFSTQIVSWSRLLRSRREARVDNLTNAKRPVITSRKKLQAEFKYICIEQN